MRRREVEKEILVSENNDEREMVVMIEAPMSYEKKIEKSDRAI